MESEKENRKSELMHWSKGSLADYIMRLEQNTDKPPVTLEQQVKNKIRNTTIDKKPEKPRKLFDAPGELSEEATAYIKMIHETAYNALYGMLYDHRIFTVRRVVENGKWESCIPQPGEGTRAVMKALYDEMGLMADDYKIFSLPEENDKTLHIVLEIGCQEIDIMLKPL